MYWLIFGHHGVALAAMENPNVVRAYNQYKTKNFTILGVSLDRPNAKEAWLKAIHKDGLPGHRYLTCNSGRAKLPI
jgi:hypothetical protein